MSEAFQRLQDHFRYLKEKHGVDTDRAFYNYNTKTEQLHTWHDVFGDQSNA